MADFGEDNRCRRCCAIALVDGLTVDTSLYRLSVSVARCIVRAAGGDNGSFGVDTGRVVSVQVVVFSSGTKVLAVVECKVGLDVVDVGLLKITDRLAECSGEDGVVVDAVDAAVVDG